MQKIICLVLIVALATSASAGYYGGIASPYMGYGMGLGYGMGMGMGLGYGGLGYGMGGYGLGFGMPGLGYGGYMGMPLYNPLMMGGIHGKMY